MTSFQSLANAGRLVHTQIIHDDDLPRPQRWHQLLGDVPLERSSGSTAPSIIHGTCRPSGASAATNVVFFPWLRGTDPLARWSCGAQP